MHAEDKGLSNLCKLKGITGLEINFFVQEPAGD